jgi:HK97 family phage major capsid protein
MPDVATAKQIRETELAPAYKQIRELADKVNAEKRDFTAEEKEQWEKVNKTFDMARARVDALERADKLGSIIEARAGDVDTGRIGRDDYDGKKAAKRQAKAAKKALKKRGWLTEGITEETRCLALQAWMRQTTGRELRKEHVKAVEACGLKKAMQHRQIDLNILDTRSLRQFRRTADAELRALAVNANVAGGYTVPEGFVNNLEIALLAYAQVRQWAEVIRTSSGQDLPWPTVNDVTNLGARVQENATIASTGADPTFGQVVFHAYKYTSKIVLVPVELLEDSAFDLAQTLGELLGIRIGRIQANEFTTGTGASQPVGYVTGAVSGQTAASSTAIAADDLYKLKHSVDPAYRAQPGVGWTFHDQILLAIKLLKDGTGRYLWQPGLAVNAPSTIDGDPYYINQSMVSAIASGNKTVVYGALRKFKIRDVSAIRMRRLVERYADSDQEAFVMFMRSDAVLVDAGTHPLKYLVH